MQLRQDVPKRYVVFTHERQAVADVQVKQGVMQATAVVTILS
jgi:hypothetical protein